MAKTRGQRTKNPGRQTGLFAVGELVRDFRLVDKGGHISTEFQDFGYRLAMELGDEAHKSLYMRLAKTVERGVLEKALSFVKDAGARSSARLFMWKLKELRKGKATSNPSTHSGQGKKQATSSGGK